MKTKIAHYVLFVSTLYFPFFSSAQSLDTIIFSKLSDFKYNFYYSVYSAQFDRTEKPYIYAASNELGLIIFCQVSQGCL